MDVSKIIAEIDAQIAPLQQARAVLLGLSENTAVSKPRRGRPKGSTNAAKTVAVKVAKPSKRKRNLSPEGRKRIAEAMKRRWAERRKEAPKAAKKVAAKKEAAPKKEAAAPKKEVVAKK
jgi:hypothetical protein